MGSTTRLLIVRRRWKSSCIRLASKRCAAYPLSDRQCWRGHSRISSADCGDGVPSSVGSCQRRFM